MSFVRIGVSDTLVGETISEAIGDGLQSGDDIYQLRSVGSVALSDCLKTLDRELTDKEKEIISDQNEMNRLRYNIVYG